jgi:hypothetical protein
LKLRRYRLVRRSSDSLDAFLKAGKRSRREVAVILNPVPAGLDAAHVGSVFADVMGSGHRSAPVRSSRRPSPGMNPWQIFCPDLSRYYCRHLLCPPTAPVLPTKRKRNFGGSRFYGQLSDKRCLSSNHMATRFLSTIAAVPSLIVYLQYSPAGCHALSTSIMGNSDPGSLSDPCGLPRVMVGQAVTVPQNQTRLWPPTRRSNEASRRNAEASLVKPRGVTLPPAYTAYSVGCGDEIVQ